MEWRFPSILESRVKLISWILVFCSFQERRQCLILGCGRVQAGYVLGTWYCSSRWNPWELTSGPSQPQQPLP